VSVSRQGALAALAWQFELGATEAIGETPVNRYALPAKPSALASEAPAAPAPVKAAPVAVAEAVAASAADLGALHAAMAAFPHCALREGARNTVFSDGNPSARVMIVGEAPGREEDERGKPFVGVAGRLLDQMFTAIGLARAEDDPERGLYITNVLPWRPPQNRDPQPDAIAMLMPF
jgi:DNA polymerase